MEVLPVRREPESVFDPRWVVGLDWLNQVGLWLAIELVCLRGWGFQGFCLRACCLGSQRGRVWLDLEIPGKRKRLVTQFRQPESISNALVVTSNVDALRVSYIVKFIILFKSALIIRSSKTEIQA